MRSRLAAGDLNQRVTIEQATTTLDSAGQPQRTWATLVADLPAMVESVTAGEALRGRQVVATASTVITVRWRSDVTVLMRVLFEGRVLGLVRAHDPYGDRRELRLECAEVVA